MAIISFWHISTSVFHQMTGIGVRKQGREKPSGYLHSKLDVTNLFVFTNSRELARAGTFPCLEFLPLWSRTYQPKMKKQVIRDVIVVYHSHI